MAVSTPIKIEVELSTIVTHEHATMDELVRICSEALMKDWFPLGQITSRSEYEIIARTDATTSINALIESGYIIPAPAPATAAVIDSEYIHE